MSYEGHTSGSYIEAVIMMMKYHFHWWRKPEYPEENNQHSHISCAQYRTRAAAV